MISLNYLLHYIWIIWCLIRKNIPHRWIFHFLTLNAPVKIDWVKNSTLWKHKFFVMIILNILNIFPYFDDDCMKIVGGVWTNVQNMPILTIRLTPVSSSLVGQRRPYCLDNLININIYPESLVNIKLNKKNMFCFFRKKNNPRTLNFRQIFNFRGGRAYANFWKKNLKKNHSSFDTPCNPNPPLEQWFSKKV